MNKKVIMAKQLHERMGYWLFEVAKVKQSGVKQLLSMHLSKEG